MRERNIRECIDGERREDKKEKRKEGQETDGKGERDS